MYIYDVPFVVYFSQAVGTLQCPQTQMTNRSVLPRISFDFNEADGLTRETE
jgi:hypothetical protein